MSKPSQNRAVFPIDIYAKCGKRYACYPPWIVVPVDRLNRKAKTAHKIRGRFVRLALYENNWRAPWKGGISTYFVAIFRVARNPPKFGMLTLFVSKNVPVFFFSTSGEMRLQTCSWKSTPPPPPPPPPPLQWHNTHTHAQCFTSQRLKSYNVWRRTQGEGVVGFRAIWSIFFCFLEKKKHRDIF